MCGKRLSIFLVVLLVASSFVWALPGAKKTTQVATAVSTAPTQESTSAPSQSSSQNETTATSKSSEVLAPVSTEKAQAATVSVSENLSESLEQSKMAATTEKLNELLTLLEKNNFVIGTEKIDTIKKTVEESVEGIAYDLELNNALISAQSSQIESLKKELKATRFFMDLGVAFGFKDKGVTYGVVGDMGMKFGQGFIVKTGAQYMVGNLNDIKNVAWSLDNLTVSATVGWEW